MSRRSKLIEKIRARPVEAEYRDVVRLLEDFGWTWDRENGSHVTFAKTGAGSFTLPKKHGRTVRRPYLDQICTLLSLDDIDTNDLDD